MSLNMWNNWKLVILEILENPKQIWKGMVALFCDGNEHFQKTPCILFCEMFPLMSPAREVLVLVFLYSCILYLVFLYLVFMSPTREVIVSCILYPCFVNVPSDVPHERGTAAML